MVRRNENDYKTDNDNENDKENDTDNDDDNDTDKDNDINRHRPSHFGPTTWLSMSCTFVLLGSQGRGGGDGGRDLWWRPKF